MNMLQVNRISKTFNPGTPNQVIALSDVSLNLAAGSFLTVIGTNGPASRRCSTPSRARSW